MHVPGYRYIRDDDYQNPPNCLLALRPKFVVLSNLATSFLTGSLPVFYEAMSFNVAGTYTLSILLPILGTTAVCARFYVRRLKKVSLQADDWTAAAGIIGLWGIAGMILNGTRHGLFGIHSKLDPVTGALIVTIEGSNVMYSWIITLLTVVTLLFIKLSVVLLYQRIFHVSTFFSYYAMALRILLVLWACGFVFATIFDCGSHLTAYWDGPEALLKYCCDTGGLNVALCFSDIIFDLMIILAPITMIWKLHIKTSRKFQVLGIFALGFLSTAAASVRTYIMWNDAYGTTQGTLGFQDVLDENTRVVVWCLIEIASALIGSCLPTLRPLVTDCSIGGIFQNLRMIVSSNSRSKSFENASEDGIGITSGNASDMDRPSYAKSTSEESGL